MNIISPWIPGFSAARCGQCGGIFDSALGNCPKGDSGESGWFPVNNTKGRDEIARLRDREAWSTAALLQIAKGLHASHLKAGIARRCLEYLAQDQHGFKTKEAPGDSDASIRKEEPIQ